MLNRITLTLVFTLSFLSYMAPDLTLPVQLAPLILFAALVFFRIGFSDFVLTALESLFEFEGLLFIFGVPLLTLGQSIESNFDKSLPYWGVISACLVLARLYLALIPIKEVLESFFWSAIICLAIFLPSSYFALLDSVRSLIRFAPYNFHPNLLAWIMSGYFCVMIWKLMTGSWRMKIVAGVGIVVCLANILFASSRGAIVGLLLGCGVIGGMAIFRPGREGRSKRLWITAMVAVLLIAAVLYMQNRTELADAYDFVDQALALSNPDRGIDSGFTGRWDKWASIIHTLGDGTFLLGHGVRASDTMEIMIDNSYLVILYDLGLLPLVLIMYRFMNILYVSFRGYFAAVDSEEKHLRLTYTLLIVVVLVINFAERSLFAVGNPFSLLTFLILAAPAWQIKSLGFVSPRDRNLSRNVLTSPLRTS
jgi:O-Antigen ligase